MFQTPRVWIVKVSLLNRMDQLVGLVMDNVSGFDD